MAPVHVGTYDYKGHPEHLKYDKDFVSNWSEFIRSQFINPLNYIQPALFKTFLNSNEVRGYLYGYLSLALLDDKYLHDIPDNRSHAIISACYYNVFHDQSDGYRKSTQTSLNEENFKIGEIIGQADYHGNKISNSLRYKNLEKMLLLMLPVDEAYATCRKMGFDPDEYFKFNFDA